MIRPPSDLNFGQPSDSSQPLHQLEINWLDEQRKDGIHLETLKGLKQDRKERRRYAEQIFTLISTWLFTVLFILIINNKANLRLSDSVIITLITTTTASVLGLFVVVINYLFKSR